MKTKFTMLSLLFSSVLMAQVTNLPTVLNVNDDLESNRLYGVVPASLSYNGSNRVYIRTAENQVAIYANNFTPIKQFDITPNYNGSQTREATREVSYTTTYGNITWNIYPDNSPYSINYYDEESGEYIDTYEFPSSWTNMDIAQYLQQYNNNIAIARIENVEQGTLFIPDWNLKMPDGNYNTDYYFNPSNSGKQYPKAAYLVNNRFLYWCWINYDAERNRTYTYGGWVESSEYETSEHVVTYGLSFVNYDTDQVMFEEEAGDGLCLTQTLFNEDEQYEYLYFPISGYKAYYQYEGPSSPDCYECESGTYTEFKELYYHSYFAGFEVKSEAGATLQSITFPNGFIMEYLAAAEIIKLSNEYYIICTGEMNENPAMLIYKINRASQSVQQVGAPIRMAAYPNPVNRNNTVTILLNGENASKTQTELQVTNMQGQVMDRHYVPAGQQKATIPAANFAPGMNIIRVQQNGKTVGSAKIVAK